MTTVEEITWGLNRHRRQFVQPQNAAPGYIYQNCSSVLGAVFLCLQSVCNEAVPWEAGGFVQ
jgi:hypothetical protein